MYLPPFGLVFITLSAIPTHIVSAVEIPEQFQQSNHTNNWAVLVNTARFWFNYRHTANVLSFYRSVKRLGIPDSQIILMNSDDMACNPRNPRPATVFNNADERLNIYGDDVEVDYRGYEVTVESFTRLLTGRVPRDTPRSKQLLTDEGSNILVYISAHGGDGFVKFQDAEVISSQELADAFEQMWQKRRYNEIFIIIDSCQAASMFKKLYSPNVLAVASSLTGEMAYTHHEDPSIGVHVIDRYAYYALQFLETIQPNSTKVMSEFLSICPLELCLSTVSVRSDLFRRNLNYVPITDFFGSVRPVILTTDPIDIKDIPKRKKVSGKKTKPVKRSYLPQFPQINRTKILN